MTAVGSTPFWTGPISSEQEQNSLGVKAAKTTTGFNMPSNGVFLRVVSGENSTPPFTNWNAAGAIHRKKVLHPSAAAVGLPRNEPLIDWKTSTKRLLTTSPASRTIKSFPRRQIGRAHV